VGSTPKPAAAPAMNGTPRQQADGTYIRDFAGYSWIVQILPFIEEKTLYDEISSKSVKFVEAGFNPTLMVDTVGIHLSTRQVAFLRCPSFSGSQYATAPEYQPFGQVAAGNYVCIPGSHISWPQDRRPDRRCLQDADRDRVARGEVFVLV
jgi:hypothetical protein